MANWQLSGCCQVQSIIFLSIFAAYFILNKILWRSKLLKPIKLLAVFFHELSHAIACWMTCGEVKGIEVYNNEGGVTKYIGGIRLFVIPAGYLGCSFWGSLFIVLSVDRITSTIVAGFIITALCVSLRYSPNRTMVILSIGFIVLTGLFIFLDWFVFDPILRYVTMYYGVSIASFAAYDIYDDLITRTVDGSDAKACHEIIPCCMPRCVGVQFVLVAIFFQALAVYLSLVWIKS